METCSSESSSMFPTSLWHFLQSRYFSDILSGYRMYVPDSSVFTRWTLTILWASTNFLRNHLFNHPSLLFQIIQLPSCIQLIEKESLAKLTTLIIRLFRLWRGCIKIRDHKSYNSGCNITSLFFLLHFVKVNKVQMERTFMIQSIWG